ncbi:MAG: restriction endonuclease subunit S [Firmicutes bacterium]|nr:restriction endonuclease subunit S [Bacillota bacterium]
MIFDDVLTIKNGRNQKAVENPKGKYPIYGSGGVMGYADDYICSANTVVIGRKGSINNPIFVECPFWNVDTAFGLEAKTDVLIPRYLYYFCKHFNFEKLNKTVTIPSLTKSDLLRIEIDLPEISKQQLIVSQLSKIEDVIALRQRQLKKLDELIKARFVELFGDPISNPNGWKTEKAETHIDLLSGFPFNSSQYTERGVNICGGLIIMPQRIEWNDCKHWCSIEGYEEYTLKKNDIVIALDRPWISEGFKIAMVDDEHLPALLIQRTARIRAIGINQFYLMYCFLLGGFDKHCNVTGSLVPHISAKDIRSFSIMLPPPELQEQFAAFVEQTDKSKVAVQAALDKAQLLFDSLMQKYFG